MPRPTNKDKIKALFDEYLAFIRDDRPEIKKAGYGLIDTLTNTLASELIKQHDIAGGRITTESQQETKNKYVFLDGPTSKKTQANIFHTGFIIYTLLFLLQKENKSFNKENYE